MFISLAITVKNEGKSIYHLLDSIRYQKKVPNEIIIVDGGSTDSTNPIIQKFKNLLPIRLIKRKGVNISQGRNIAVKNCKNSIIAVTDGGCRLDENWLYEITRPFKNNNIDVVAGIYKGKRNSRFQKICDNLLIYNFDKIDINSFQPSSRSIAFRKQAWKDVGGYPEWLEYGEDTYFDIRLKKAGKRFYLNKKAMVYWDMFDGYSNLFNTYFHHYSFYDALAFQNIGFYLLRFLIWFILFTLGTLLIQIHWSMIIIIPFFIFSIFFSRSYLKQKEAPVKDYFLGTIILALVETANLTGFLYGLFYKVLSKLKRFRRTEKIKKLFFYV